MNIYHITYAPGPASVQLHFWGCNINCRACLLKREIYDCHLEETKERIRQPHGETDLKPQTFLDLASVMGRLTGFKVREVIFMGAEPSLDPELPVLTARLHHRFGCRNILLTNGFQLPDLAHIDEVVFSIKAFTDSLHRDYTGASNKKVLENFIHLYRTGIKLRTESIFIPGYIDCAEIEKIALFIAGVDSNIPYRIDAYIPVGGNPWRRPSPGEIEDAARLARKHLKNVSYLTGNEPLRYEVVRLF